VPGTLYVVATPIGNLEDLSPRALKTLRDVDAIASEDTRTTLKLLTHFGIRKPLIAYFQHSGERREDEILERLARGQAIALVTEAGTPAVSDPGAEIVAKAHERGIPVRAIAGPSSVAAALSVSGFGGDRYVFEGFLPRKPGKRRKALKALAAEERTLVFFESPHRIVETLEAMVDAFGDRACCIARELTKLHEEVTRTTLAKALADWRAREPRGEYTVVVAGATGAADDD
jgi:16S rRNA (cytidine1402-2'-O)-methyltransferase